MDKVLIDLIITEAADLEDGHTGMDQCIEFYCKERPFIDKATMRAAQREAFKRGALDAGIPLSVIEGKTKLSDHFSESYINYKCGKVSNENAEE